MTPRLLARLFSLLVTFSNILPALARNGHVVMHNHCVFPIYVSQSRGNPIVARGPSTIIPAGDTWMEPFNTIPHQGVAMFLGPKNNGPRPFSFEYTLHTDGRIYYDASAVDGNPFRPEGYSIVPDLACPQVHCHPRRWCDATFYAPRDGNVYTCSKAGDLHVHLCRP